ncbi:MAG: hypothetical protein IJP31_01050 [Lachnospiraceae bacterium]|nr:hypothetical protein [Lachnospiraceae bacterium]
MQLMSIGNQLSTCNLSAKAGRTSRYTQVASFNFGKTFQEKQINQVKQEIYEKFGISVGSYGKSFSCYIPSNVLYQISCNSQMKEKVYEQLESYSPENYEKSIAGLNPPVKRCTLIFDEGGDATATMEAAASEEDLASSVINNNAYLSYLKGQSAMLSYNSNGLSSLYGLNSLYGGSGYNLSSLYGLNSPYTTSFYGNLSRYNTNSLFTSIMSRLSSRI